MEKAYFAGGCFWCIASAFRSLDGVTEVTEGYEGGRKEDASYHAVKSQTTGHRETVCVTYDRDRISYSGLLDHFFLNTDPFDGEGQFIDRGFSYTLAVFHTCDEERELAAAKIRALERESGRRVHVALIRHSAFFPAEEEHCSYGEKNPEALAEELEISGRNAFFSKKG